MTKAEKKILFDRYLSEERLSKTHPDFYTRASYEGGSVSLYKLIEELGLTHELDMYEASLPYIPE